MKAKLLINGKELEVEVSWAELQKLEEKQKKKTGYERVELDEHYYYVDCSGKICEVKKYTTDSDDVLHAVYNCYSDRRVAENNARADKLMRQLRRFSVEHRETELDWNECTQDKYVIQYAHDEKILEVSSWVSCHEFGCIFFDSAESAKLAIDTFHDELIWYFTEYKDSL